MPGSFLVQLFGQRELNQLLGVGIDGGRLSPQTSGKESDNNQDTDDRSDGRVQGGRFGERVDKKRIPMHREDTLISLLNQGYLG